MLIFMPCIAATCMKLQDDWFEQSRGSHISTCRIECRYVNNVLKAYMKAEEASKIHLECAEKCPQLVNNTYSFVNGIRPPNAIQISHNMEGLKSCLNSIPKNSQEKCIYKASFYQGDS